MCIRSNSEMLSLDSKTPEKEGSTVTDIRKYQNSQIANIWKCKPSRSHFGSGLRVSRA